MKLKSSRDTNELCKITYKPRNRLLSIILLTIFFVLKIPFIENIGELNQFYFGNNLINIFIY